MERRLSSLAFCAVASCLFWGSKVQADTWTYQKNGRGDAYLVKKGGVGSSKYDFFRIGCKANGEKRIMLSIPARMYGGIARGRSSGSYSIILDIDTRAEQQDYEFEDSFRTEANYVSGDMTSVIVPYDMSSSQVEIEKHLRRLLNTKNNIKFQIRDDNTAIVHQFILWNERGSRNINLSNGQKAELISICDM